MTYDWEIVLLREVPGPDGRVSSSAFVGSYRLTSSYAENVPGYLASLPVQVLREAVWIGITRLEQR